MQAKRQPKYQIGQKLTKEVSTKVEGQNATIKVTHYVVTINAESTDRDFEYKYRVASSFPSAYSQPSYQSDFIYENALDKVYTVEND